MSFSNQLMREISLVCSKVLLSPVQHIAALGFRLRGVGLTPLLVGTHASPQQLQLGQCRLTRVVAMLDQVAARHDTGASHTAPAVDIGFATLHAPCVQLIQDGTLEIHKLIA